MNKLLSNCLLAMLVLGACQKKDPLGTELLSEDSIYSRKRVDPYQIEFAVGKAYVEAKFAGSSHIVPKVKINFASENKDLQADFYQVQRCHKSVVLRASDGKDPLTFNYGRDKLSRIRDYLYVWGSATTDTVGCRFLDGVHLSDPFIDLVVGSGSFYYLIRPCLMAKHSIYGNKRVCHYKFHKTGVIDYTDMLNIEQRQTMSQLNEYASELQYTFTQIASVMREMASYLQTCEFNEAQKIAAKRRLVGIVKVALTVTSAVVATVVSGPQNAFFAGSATIKLTDKIFSGISNATINCPTGSYQRKIDLLRERADRTVGIIGQLRHELEEIKLDTRQEPIEHTEIYRKIKSGDADFNDLLVWLRKQG